MILVNLHPAKRARQRVRARRAGLSLEQRVVARKGAADRARARRVANPETVRAAERERYYTTDRRQRNIESTWRHVLRGYGLTVVGYLALVDAERNRCACCGTSEPGRGSAHWCVDHDHATGEIRGLLCHTCNVGIGMLGDTAEAVARAHVYLTRRRSLTP